MGISVTVIGLSFSGMIFEKSTPEETNPEETNLQNDFLITPDVIMPTKVSRPGCDIEDICYIPSKIVVEKGDSVTWLNEDSSFHSVTSGVYGEQIGRAHV